VSLFLEHFTKWISNVCQYKEITHMFSKLLWHSISAFPMTRFKMFSHLEWLCREQNTVSQATCCPLATGWMGLVYTIHIIFHCTAALSMLSQFSVANINGFCRAWNCFSSSHKLVTQAKHTSWYWPL